MYITYAHTEHLMLWSGKQNLLAFVCNSSAVSVIFFLCCLVSFSFVLDRTNLIASFLV